MTSEVKATALTKNFIETIPIYTFEKDCLIVLLSNISQQLINVHQC